MSTTENKVIQFPTPALAAPVIAPTQAIQVPQLTKEQAIIVSGFTGHVLCDLDDFLVDLSARMGVEVTEAELQIPGNAEVIKATYAADLQKLLPVDWAKEDARVAEPVVLATPN